MKMIDQIKKMDIEVLKNSSKDNLITIYQEGCGNLTSDAEGLFNKYDTFKNSRSKKNLEKQITEYEVSVDAFAKITKVFHHKYVYETVPSEKTRLNYFVSDSQIYLTRLQNQCNQLIYRKQQLDNRRSIIIAYCALMITLVFSVLAFLDIKCPIKNPTPCSSCPVKTEQTQTIPETENSEIDNNALPLPDTIK